MENRNPWIYCVLIVDFEIEKGQVIEYVYPKDTYLTDVERNNVVYLAFPDSNSNVSNNFFHISLRTNQQLSTQQRLYNRECRQDLRADVSHFWGYVYFRQVKDSTLKRGYFQKSFVLISRLPFHNFFYELANRWAAIYFSTGTSALEQGYEQTLSWPKLTVNTPLQLPILGSVYQLYIAGNRNTSDTTTNNSTTSNTATTNSTDEPEDVTNNNQNDSSSNNGSSSMNSIPISINTPNEIDIFSAVHIVLHHLQLIWELVLLAEPIVIIAPSPSDSSLMVQALTNLIAPLEYHPEVKFFIIHSITHKLFFIFLFLGLSIFYNPQ
jgi:hypothetical protein